MFHAKFCVGSFSFVLTNAMAEDNGTSNESTPLINQAFCHAEARIPLYQDTETTDGPS